MFDYYEIIGLINNEDWEMKSLVSLDPDNFKSSSDWAHTTHKIIEEILGHLNGACNNL